MSVRLLQSLAVLALAAILVRPSSADTLGACCMADGTCRLTEEAACYESNGLAWRAEEDCLEDCSPVGGCCMRDGECAIVTPEACLNAQGEFMGLGEACPPFLCAVVVGACHDAANRFIGWTSYESCCYVRINNVWRYRCATRQNPRGYKWIPPRLQQSFDFGSCCLPSGECQTLSPDSCDAAGGEFHGPDAPCDSLYCGEPVPLGQCCDADGSCQVAYETECARRGGAQFVPFDLCETDCPPPGACCLPNGVCAFVIGISCDVIGGAFHGDGVSCGAVECMAVPAERGSWGAIKARFR